MLNKVENADDDDEDDNKSDAGDEEGEEDDEDDEDDDDDDDSSRKKNTQKRKCGYDVSDGSTIFVRNIPFTANEKDLRGALTQFGKILSAKLVKSSEGEGH